MAYLTRGQLKAYLRARITDPLNFQVTPAVERAVLEIIIDNVPNIADDGPGNGGGPTRERPLQIDATFPLAYARFADRITRLDYTAGAIPPVQRTHLTNSPVADWAIRSTLSFS